MKKSRGALAFLFAFMLMASMVALTACGGSQSSASKDSLSVNSEPTQSEEPIVLRTDPFYVLVVGDDTRQGTVNMDGQYGDGKGRSDTLMLVRVDPTNYKLTLCTIPRDTQATYDGRVCKINETYHEGGIEALLDAVSDLTGKRPDYYLITTFVGFQNLVDDLGGLNIHVPIYEVMDDVVTNDPVEFDAGDQTLNGKEALVFARDRHSYDYTGNGEPYRQTNDRRILQRLIEQVIEGNKPSVEVAEQLLSHIDTNWDTRELLAYVQNFVDNYDKLSFIRCTGPYDGGVDPDTQLWLATRDEDKWAAIMAVIDEGGDPSEINPEPIAAEQDFMNDGAADEEASGEAAPAEGEAAE